MSSSAWIFKVSIAYKLNWRRKLNIETPYTHVRFDTIYVMIFSIELVFRSFNLLALQQSSAQVCDCERILRKAKQNVNKLKNWVKMK